MRLLFCGLFILIVNTFAFSQDFEKNSYYFGILKESIEYEKEFEVKERKETIKCKYILEKNSLVKILDFNEKNENCKIEFNIITSEESNFEGDAPTLFVDKHSIEVKKNLLLFDDTINIPDKYYYEIFKTLYSDNGLPTFVKSINNDTNNNLITISYTIRDAIEAIDYVSLYKILEDKLLLITKVSCNSCENEIIENYLKEKKN